MRVAPCDCHLDTAPSSSTGIEIIEVNGAVFYRKRKVAPTPPPAATPAAKKACGGDGSKGTPEAVAGPGGETHELSQESSAVDPVVDGAMALAEKPPVDALDVLNRQLEACLPASCPKAISVQV